MKYFLLFALLFISFNSVFAEEYYDIDEYVRLSSDPSFCIIQSDIPNFDRYELLVIQGIIDWQNSLQMYTQDRDLWNFDYSTLPIEETDECLTLVWIVEDFNEELAGETAWGDDGSSLIVIYNIHNETPEMIVSTVSHEVGHVLGLGHYMTDDILLEIQWDKGNDIPSIMLEFIPANNIGKITETDLETIVVMYGEDGFGGVNPVIEYDYFYDVFNEEFFTKVPEWFLVLYDWYDYGLISEDELYDAEDYLYEQELIYDYQN